MLPPLIRAIEYDVASRILTIHFQVGTYQFEGVPSEVGLEQGHILNKDDLLAWFNSKIEGKYKSRRVE